MAIAWEFTITPIDVPNKIVSVSATRTDDEPESHQYTVVLQNADISTSAKKTEALDVLWAKYEKKVADQVVLDSIATEISELEDAAKTNFEGREP